MNKNVKIIAVIGALLILAMILFIIFGGKKETFTVSFYTDEGNRIESQTIEEGERVSRPVNPTKDGYIFDNWYIGDDIYDFTLKVTKNITLSAKWVKDNTSEEDNEEVIAEKYTVTFNSNGGSSVESVVVEKGQTVNKPTNPTRKNYEFVSWQLNGKDYDFSKEITSDITLVAKWKKDTVVTYKVEATDSFVGQVKIFVIKDGTEKVDGLVDIEFVDGNVQKDVSVRKDGLTINKDKYKTISNPRIK